MADMTTNTDGAIPELPTLPVRYSYELEPNEDDLTPDDEIDVFTADQMRDYARTAIQQAAGAVPEMVSVGYQYMFSSPFGGYVWRDSPDEWNGVRAQRSREIFAASPAPPKQQPVHLGGGEVGGVPQWLPIETAPKWVPGTEREFVLLWCPNAFNVERVKVGYVEANGAVYSMYEATGEMGSEPQRDATHWMPIPTTPEAK